MEFWQDPNEVYVDAVGVIVGDLRNSMDDSSDDSEEETSRQNFRQINEFKTSLAVADKTKTESPITLKI